jgi:hypothetical protein
VAFLESLTDERVRFERAPFDHPALRVPHGHVDAAHALDPDLAGDRVLAIAAVGAEGRSEPLLSFAEVLDACAEGCADDVALFAPAALPPPDEFCSVPEPPGAGAAAVAVLLACAATRRVGATRVTR